CILRAAARIALADVRGDRDFQTRLIGRKERLEVTLVGVVLPVQTRAGILEPTNSVLLTAECASKRNAVPVAGLLDTGADDHVAPAAHPFRLARRGLTKVGWKQGAGRLPVARHA